MTAQKTTILAFVLGAAVSAGGTALYFSQAERDATEQQTASSEMFPKFPTTASAPDQAEMGGMPGAAPARTGLADVPTMITRLASRLEKNPDNPEGWRMLGWSYLATGNAPEAVKAYAKAIALRDDDAQYRSAYGEALVGAANGTVTPEAKAAFDAALAIDPGDERARYFTGLALRQGGDARAAYDTWLTLTKDLPPGSPILQDLRTNMASVSRELGIAPPAVPQPDGPATPATAMGGAGGMPPAQAERIRGMVEGLARRLKESPDDADGWRMLGKTYGVLGNYAGSVQAYAKLIALRPDDLTALRVYAEAVLKTVPDGEPYPVSLTSTLDRLHRANPRDEFALFHLAESSSRAGNRDKAVKYWHSLLKLLPGNSPMRETVVSRLQDQNRARPN